MNQSESINELASALSKAQGQLEGAKKDKANPFFRSVYADLSSVWDACRQALSSNGLSIIQSPEEAESGIAIETMMVHSSGQWVKSRYTMPVSKMDAQAVGSAITYARRYALASIVGIAPEDDDGNAAASSKPTVAQKSASLPLYDDKKLRENIPAWQAAIISKKATKDSIINMISTKHTLTEEQKETIRTLGESLENA